MKPADKYHKIVEFSDEDNCYIGSIPGFLGPCCHGENELDVYNKLCQILGEWIEIHEEDEIPLPESTNKDYSGKFLLRIDKELHKILTLRAKQANQSLNQFIESLLKRNLKKSV